MEKHWLKIAEAAEHVGVSRMTVYRWIRQGKLPSHKVGGIVRVKLEDVDKLLEEGREIST